LHVGFILQLHDLLHLIEVGGFVDESLHLALQSCVLPSDFFHFTIHERLVLVEGFHYHLVGLFAYQILFNQQKQKLRIVVAADVRQGFALEFALGRTAMFAVVAGFEAVLLEHRNVRFF
jgi:hypothetical protein